MKSSDSYKILPEPNVIDDHLLDIIGNEFKFDHEKGVSELLKNSVDAYIRAEVPGSQQNIVLRFADAGSGKATFECVDFAGMDIEDIT